MTEYLAQQKRQLEDARTRLDSAGEPPDDGTMENRVIKLEEFVGEARTELRAIDVRLTKIETRLDAIATKADVQETASATIKWMVGTAAVMFSMGVVIITFVLNNAIPKSPAAQPAPIIITVPMSAPVPAPLMK